MAEQEREYILYFYDGRVRRVTGKLSELQKLPVSRIEEVKKMTEQKIPPAVIIIPIGLGLGLAVALGAYTVARAARGGFTLSIVNPPPESTQWVANLGAESLDFEPVAGSPVLGINEPWNYEGLYKGSASWSVIGLTITIADADDNLLLQPTDLGPIENGRSYIYDCATGQLSEV